MRMNSSPLAAGTSQNGVISSSSPPLPPTSSLLLSSSPTSISTLTSTTQISPRRSRLSNATTKLLTNTTSAEEEVLGQIAKDAETRLAARRAARAEAREIRLREMERQKKEMEETSDRHYELLSGDSPTGGLVRMSSVNNSMRTPPNLYTREVRTGSFTSSRRSSQESLDSAGIASSDVARELRHQMHELEEKFRKAMINNAQLDNEKQAFVYQVDLYKDDFDEIEENYIRLQRDHKEKSKNFDQMKRDYERLKDDFAAYKAALEERDRLILEAGLVLIRNESDQKIRLCSQKVLTNGFAAMHNGEGKLMNGNIEDCVQADNYDLEHPNEPLELLNNISLISKQASTMLRHIPGDTLETKLASILSENRSLQSTIKDVNAELDEEKQRFNTLNDLFHNNSRHLTTEMEAEIQREANKITNDLRYKLKKAEQEIQTLNASVSRLETQVSRYKTQAEESEKDADEQKTEKRKAQRELREAQTLCEELESANKHLQKRIDKLKSNRGLISANSISVPTTPTPNNMSAPFTGSANMASNGTASPCCSSADTSTECSSECSSTIAD